MDEVTYVKKKKKKCKSNLEQLFLNSGCITNTTNNNPLPPERDGTETSVHHFRD